MQKQTQHWVYASLCIGAISVFFFTVLHVNIWQGSVQITPPGSVYGQTSSETDVCTDLLAYWKLDEGTGTTITDATGADNEGTFVGMTASQWKTATPDAMGYWDEYALNFPGNGYVRVASGVNLDVTEDLTIVLWMKYTMLAPYKTANMLLSFGGNTEETSTESKYDNYLYALNINGVEKNIRLSWENGSDARDIIVESSIAPTLSATTWAQIVVSRDATSKKVKFYINGAQLGSEQSYAIVPSGNSGGMLFIGVGPHNPSGTYFKGLIDDVRLYNTVLSATEITELYSNSSHLSGCTCGNNEVEPPEQCDDGNDISTDNCTASCTVMRCGDGYIQPSNGEECELPGTSVCSNQCKKIGTSTSSAQSSSQSIPPNCGNRLVEANEGEECDEGHLNGKGNCSTYCTVLYCGDGILSPEISEECEPTPVSYINGVPEFDEPVCGDTCSIPEKSKTTGKFTGGCKRLFLQPCDMYVSARSSSSAVETSSALHSAAPPEPQACGNGEIDEDEQCDDGSICVGGTSSGSTITTATDVERCIAGGGANEAQSNDGCSSVCVIERCGDGIVQSPAGEQCDNGSVCTNDTSKTCNTAADCSTAVPCAVNSEGEKTCGGDTGGKACSTDDDCTKIGSCIYNYTADDFCTNACTSISVCGDSEVQGLEECDDGNATSGDGCSATCASETVAFSTSAASISPTAATATCGNYIIEQGEECDDGATNSNVIANACRTTCKNAYCGDSVVDANEQCDAGSRNSDAEPDTCRMNCVLPRCGDGVLDSGEECDGSANCSSDCRYTTAAICGDLKIQGTEKCDDGNFIAGDGCSPTCQVEPKLLQITTMSSSSTVSKTSTMVEGAQYTETYPASAVSSSPAPSTASSFSSLQFSLFESSAASIFTLRPIQQIPLQGNIQQAPMQPTHAPIGDTGPAAVLAIATGASSGFLWIRRKKRS